MAKRKETIEPYLIVAMEMVRQKSEFNSRLSQVLRDVENALQIDPQPVLIEAYERLLAIRSEEAEETRLAQLEELDAGSKDFDDIARRRVEAYKESGNPLFLWEVLRLFAYFESDARYAGKSLPPEVVQYLWQCAHGILEITERWPLSEVHSESSSSDRMSDLWVELAEALKLKTRKGSGKTRNLFKEHQKTVAAEYLAASISFCEEQFLSEGYSKKDAQSKARIYLTARLDEYTNGRSARDNTVYKVVRERSKRSKRSAG